MTSARGRGSRTPTRMMRLLVASKPSKPSVIFVPGHLQCADQRSERHFPPQPKIDHKSKCERWPFASTLEHTLNRDMDWFLRRLFDRSGIRDGKHRWFPLISSIFHSKQADISKVFQSDAAVSAFRSSPTAYSCTGWSVQAVLIRRIADVSAVIDITASRRQASDKVRLPSNGRSPILSARSESRFSLHPPRESMCKGPKA